MKNKNIQSEEKALFYPSLCQRDSIKTKLGGTPENGGGAETPLLLYGAELVKGV
jgi:hypothetical protein